MPIVLYDKEKSRRLFEITEPQLNHLVAALEKERAQDHDYYIDAAVCDFLEGKIDDSLLSELRKAIGIGAPADSGDAVAAAGEEEELPEADLPENGLEIEWRQE